MIAARSSRRSTNGQPPSVPSRSTSAPAKSMGVVAAGIDRGERAAADPARSQLGQEQRDFAGIVTRHDDGEIRGVAVHHRPLAAGDLPRSRGRGHARDRDCPRPLQGRSSRSPSLPPTSAAGAASARRCRPAARPRWRGRRTSERHRSQGSAEFLREHTKSLVAQTGAAIRFGDRRAEPSHLRHRPPKRGGIGFVAFEHVAHDLRWRWSARNRRA